MTESLMESRHFFFSELKQESCIECVDSLSLRIKDVTFIIRMGVVRFQYFENNGYFNFLSWAKKEVKI